MCAENVLVELLGGCFFSRGAVFPRRRFRVNKFKLILCTCSHAQNYWVVGPRKDEAVTRPYSGLWKARQMPCTSHSLDSWSYGSGVLSFLHPGEDDWTKMHRCPRKKNCTRLLGCQSSDLLKTQSVSVTCQCSAFAQASNHWFH